MARQISNIKQINPKKLVLARYSNEDVAMFYEILTAPLKNKKPYTQRDLAKAMQLIANKAQSRFMQRNSAFNPITKASVAYYEESFRLASYKYKKENKLIRAVLTNAFRETAFYIRKYFNDVQTAFNYKTGEIKDKEAFNKLKTRAKTIAISETVRLTNASSQAVAVANDFNSWVWGASNSKNPSEEHRLLYGKVSEIGETPSKDSLFPGERPNCRCEMIFVKVEKDEKLKDQLELNI